MTDHEGHAPDLDEKLNARTQGTPGPAIQHLKDLRKRWGVVLGDWTRAPDLIVVNTMDHRETWKLRGAPPGEKPGKLDRWYELLEKVPR